MKFEKTEIPGVILVEPDVYGDVRGFFLETYHLRKYRDGGIPGPFIQDNHSCSAQGVVRGLHAQREHPQGKLVRVIEGEIFDVAVDVRRGSPRFARWVGVTLSADNHKQIYVPPGFVHGFAVISPVAQVEYKCTDFYHPGDQMTVRWDDPEIGIHWPVDEPILSEKDKNAPTLEELMDSLPVWRGGETRDPLSVSP